MTHEDTMLIIGCGIVGFGLVWLYFPSRAKPPIIDHEYQTDEHFKREETPKKDGHEQTSYPSWCDILLVEPNAGQAEIRRAFARVMKSIHPDTSTHDAATTARCEKVQRAYELAKIDARTRGQP